MNKLNGTKKMDVEMNECSFCKELKQVERTYLKPSSYVKPVKGYNKLYNEGDYFIIIYTCNDCGKPKVN